MKAAVQAVQQKISVIPPVVKKIAWAVGIIFILVVAIWALIKLKGKIQEKEERKKIDYIEGGGDVPTDFNAEKYANLMFNATEGVSLASTKNSVAEELMKLNDNELIAVHNYWNKYLYDRHSETMYKAMNAEWDVPGGSFSWMFDTTAAFGTNHWQPLINRLSRLKLISK